MLGSWRFLARSLRPRLSKPRRASFRPGVETMEQRLVPTRLSLPTTLAGDRGSVIAVPINVDVLSQSTGGNLSGLTGADFVVFYDPSVFTMSGSDIKLGTVKFSGSTTAGNGYSPTATNGWTVSASTTTPGQVTIGLSNSGSGIITAAASGSLVTINFHIKNNAPFGAAHIDLAANVFNGPPNTHVSDQSFTDFNLSSAPQNNTILSPMYSYTGSDAGDGLVTINSSMHFAVSAVSTAQAGTAVTFTVSALNANNSPNTAYAGIVHFTSSDAQAVLPADATLSGGVGTFTSTLKTAGSQILIAADTATAAITGATDSITVSPAAAAQFRVTVPVNAKVGAAFNITVAALDSFNNLATAYAGTVHFSSGGGQIQLPADATLTAGSGTFHVIAKTAGTTTITATDTAATSITGTSGLIDVGQTHFGLIVPANVSAGVPFNVTVETLDQFGGFITTYNGTVHFTASGGQAQLPADAGLSNGEGTFSMTLNSAGIPTITATDTIAVSLTGTSSPITVAAGTGTHFAIQGMPASTTAGASFTMTVVAQDAFGNTATGYAGIVHFTSTDNSAVLPADFSFGVLDQGVHVFSGGVTLNTSGSQTFTATDSATAAITGSASVNVTPAPAAATHFSVIAPANITMGQPFSFTVTALGAGNATATGYTGTVHFTSTDPLSNLAADATLTGGIGAFTATLMTASFQTISATDTASVGITGSSNTINVITEPPSHFSVTGPSTAIAGTPLSVTVTALDAFNNAAVGYTGTVHFTSPDSRAILPADATLTGGSGAFSVTMKTAGGQTVTAVDVAASSIAGTSNVIAVNPAEAATLEFRNTPATTVAGTAFTTTLAALDSFGNVATNYGGTIHFTSTDGQASLPADTTLTLGEGSFSATLKSSGGQTVTAADAVSPSFHGVSSSVSVQPHTADHFAVSAPGTATAGTPVSVTVTALDPFGNYDSSYTGTVHFTSSDAQAALPSNAALTAGSGSFNVTFHTAGSQTVTAADAASPGIASTSAAVTVSPAAVGLDADHRYVQGLYRQILGRDGSTVELNGWVVFVNQHGHDLLSVASAIEQSAEGREHLVRSYYVKYLGRNASGGEELGWVNGLLGGATEQQIQAGILASAEFAARADAMFGSSSSTSNFVQALYHTLLDRTGSSIEVAGWTGQLLRRGRMASQKGKGETGNALDLMTRRRDAIARFFLSSSEHHFDQVVANFQTYLQRKATAAEIQSQLASTDDLAAIRLAIESSSEFYADQ
jgi:hypothetical protein